jgi:hypothetical protein
VVQTLSIAMKAKARAIDVLEPVSSSFGVCLLTPRMFFVHASAAGNIRGSEVTTALSVRRFQRKEDSRTSAIDELHGGPDWGLTPAPDATGAPDLDFHLSREP